MPWLLTGRLCRSPSRCRLRPPLLEDCHWSVGVVTGNTALRRAGRSGRRLPRQRHSRALERQRFRNFSASLARSLASSLCFSIACSLARSFTCSFCFILTFSLICRLACSIALIVACCLTCSLAYNLACNIAYSSARSFI